MNTTFSNPARKHQCILLLVCLSIPVLLYVVLAQQASWKPRTVSLNLNERHEVFVFSPDSKVLLTYSTDRSFRFWDAATGTLSTTVSHSAQEHTITNRPLDGKTLCRIVKDRTFYASGLMSHQIMDIPFLLLYWNHKTMIDEKLVVLSRDARLLAITRANDYADERKGVGIDVWDVSRCKIVSSINVKSNKEYRSSPVEFTSLAFSPDNKILAAIDNFNYDWFNAGNPGYLEFELWDVSTGQLLPMSQKVGAQIPSDSSLNALTYSPTDQFVALEAGNKVGLIDTHTGMMRLLAGHSDKVTALAFSPDGKRLASGSMDKTVRVWDVLSGRTERILRGHTQKIDFDNLAFAPNGSSLASSDGKTINFWRMK